MKNLYGTGYIRLSHLNISAIILLAIPWLSMQLAAEDSAEARLSALVRQPAGTLFRVTRTAGKYQFGDTLSRFHGQAECKGLTFDVSNNRMLANHGAQGALLSVTSYRDSYFAVTPDWPGVWACKDNTTTGSYWFTVENGNTRTVMLDCKDDFETTLIDNLIPQTVIKPTGRPYLLRTLTFAPMSSDGTRRLAGVVYALEIENTGDEALDFKVTVPRIKAGSGPYSRWAQMDGHSSPDMTLLGREFAPQVSISVPGRQTRWLPVILDVPGEGTVAELEKEPLDWWLSQTLKYYRSVMGRLETPAEPFLGEFYERQMMQALQSIAMAPSGRAAGSNWGSAPPTRMIWTKDFYYSCLGVLTADPALAEKLIEWFDRCGVRPVGTHERTGGATTKTAGGVSHSISLSVAAPLMAAVLYENTGDTTIFTRHPDWKNRWAKILDDIIASRNHEEVWLFPTRYISDGPVKGDFHTGSNICVWKALVGYARLLREVWMDPAAAEKYEKVAADIKAAIITRNVLEGEAGDFLVEATNYDEKPPRIESDGEESDTTLAPAYGFMDANDPLYVATMKFAMSPANSAYRPALNSLSWEGSVPSSAPGYNKGVASALTHDECWGERGHFTEMRRVADADGSIWWWTYGQAKQPDPLRPERLFMGIGKSGWASGVYAELYRSRMVGIRHDAPERRLRIAPMATLGSFTWKQKPLGGSRFDLSFDPKSGASVNNPTQQVLHVEWVLPEGRWAIGGTPVVGENLTHLGIPSTLVKQDLPAGQTLEIRQVP